MSVLKAIGKYILLLSTFILTFIATVIAATVICILLVALHLDTLTVVQRLMDDYIWGLPFLCAVFSYSAVQALAEKLRSYPALLAVGITLTIVHLVYAVINLINANFSSILTNICIIVAGILLAVSAKEQIKTHANT